MKKILVRYFAEAERGEQTRVADALGVRPPTVNKWAKGYNIPEPKHWAQLEQLLRLPTGTLVIGNGVTPPDVDTLAEIRVLMAELGVRLDAVECKLDIRPRPRSDAPAKRSSATRRVRSAT